MQKDTNRDLMSSVRGPCDFRPIFFRVGVSTQNLGSCYFESGGTKILAVVDGPFENSSERSYLHILHRTERVPLEVRCTISTRSAFTKHKAGGKTAAAAESNGKVDIEGSTSLRRPDGDIEKEADTRQNEEIADAMSNRLMSALASALIPTSDVDEQSVAHRYVLRCDVLEADGSVFSALCSASALALAEAGIRMCDMPVGVSAAVNIADSPAASEPERLKFDPSKSDEVHAQVLVDCCVLPGWRQFSAFELHVANNQAALTTDAIGRIQQACLDAASSLHAVFRTELLQQTAAAKVNAAEGR